MTNLQLLNSNNIFFNVPMSWPWSIEYRVFIVRTDYSRAPPRLSIQHTSDRVMILAGFSITLSDPSLLGHLVHLSKCLMKWHSCGLNLSLHSSIKTMTAGIRVDFIFLLIFMTNMSLVTHMNIFGEQFDNEDDEKTQRPIIGECDVGFKRWFVVVSPYCVCSPNRFVADKTELQVYCLIKNYKSINWSYAFSPG